MVHPSQLAYQNIDNATILTTLFETFGDFDESLITEAFNTVDLDSMALQAIKAINESVVFNEADISKADKIIMELVKKVEKSIKTVNVKRANERDVEFWMSLLVAGTALVGMMMIASGVAAMALIGALTMIAGLIYALARTSTFMGESGYVNSLKRCSDRLNTYCNSVKDIQIKEDILAVKSTLDSMIHRAERSLKTTDDVRNAAMIGSFVGMAVR